MGRLLHPVFALLASVTRQELARQVAYLKEENRILRARLPERLVATPQVRRHLLRFGHKLGQQLKELISIVSYQSFFRWVRDAEAAHTAKKAVPKAQTRPATDSGRHPESGSAPPGNTPGATPASLVSFANWGLRASRARP